MRDVTSFLPLLHHPFTIGLWQFRQESQNKWASNRKSFHLTAKLKEQPYYPIQSHAFGGHCSRYTWRWRVCFSLDESYAFPTEFSKIHISLGSRAMQIPKPAAWLVGGVRCGVCVCVCSNEIKSIYNWVLIRMMIADSVFTMSFHVLMRCGPHIFSCIGKGISVDKHVSE